MRGGDVKVRWTKEEVFLLASKEVELGEQRHMNLALAPHFPQRSSEAIKCRRKYPEYRRLVEEIRKRHREAPLQQAERINPNDQQGLLPMADQQDDNIRRRLRPRRGREPLAQAKRRPEPVELNDHPNDQRGIDMVEQRPDGGNERKPSPPGGLIGRVLLDEAVAQP